MSSGREQVEDFVIVAWVVLRIVQEFNSSVELPAFMLDSALIMWLIYDRIPRLLNRRFSDEHKAFSSDSRLRLGLVFFPLMMYLLFVLNVYIGYFLLPNSLLGVNTLELGHSIFGIVVIVFVSIYYFSWWLWKYEDLAEQLWKMTSWTETEFEKEKVTAERSQLYSLVSKYLGPGIVPMGVCVLLFMGWLVLTFADLLMIGLLLLWLFHNLVHQLPLKRALKRWDRIVEGDFVWKAVARAGIASLDRAVDAIMIIFGFMIIALLATIDWSTFIGVMLFFNGWFILFMLFAIGLRSSARVRIKGRRQSPHESSFISMPRFADLTLLSSYIMISAFSLSTLFEVTESLRVSYVLVSIALNLLALTTIIWWLKKKEKRYRLSEKKEGERRELVRDLLRDRYRLYATIFFLGLPIVAAAGVLSALVLWIGLVGGVVMLSFDADFRKRIQKQRAGVYASLLTAYMGTSIFMILGAAMYGLPELKLFLASAGVLFTILLVAYWLAIFRIKRRWKWK